MNKTVNPTDKYTYLILLTSLETAKQYFILLDTGTSVMTFSWMKQQQRQWAQLDHAHGTFCDEEPDDLQAFLVKWIVWLSLDS